MYSPKFRVGDTIVVTGIGRAWYTQVGEVPCHKPMTISVIDMLYETECGILIPIFLEDSMELEEIYNSPLIKALRECIGP